MKPKQNKTKHSFSLNSQTYDSLDTQSPLTEWKPSIFEIMTQVCITIFSLSFPKDLWPFGRVSLCRGKENTQIILRNFES